jgi:uncharacterized protein YqeY
METKARLETELKEAMRSGDTARKSTIRMALSAIRFTEVEQGKPLDEPGVISVLQKELKSRQEALAEAEKANRPDLASAARQESAILESFLPQPYTPAELEALIRQAVAESGATNPNDMGKVMKLVTPRLQGRATGSQASQLVRQILQNTSDISP